jgi:hypothetical protein
MESVTTEELKSNPTEELKQFLAIARDHSTASESTVRKDFLCTDGVLVVSSHAGGEVEYAVESKELHKAEYPDTDPA